MGLFSKKKAKKEIQPAVEEVKDEELDATGWHAITQAFEKLYPDQKDPRHYGVLIPWRLGGNDPLQGISIYEASDYYHFVTYGFSELYEKEFENKEYSGYGFELTLKLKKAGLSDDEAEIKGICGILQALARETFQHGDIFQPEEYIYTGQKTGMDVKAESKITGFITTLDEAGEIDTPNGKVQFVQLIGMQDQELQAIVDHTYRVHDLLEKLPDTLTDYTRESVI
ncbi:MULTISPECIES: suppressor of fused domain protein [Bacillota]|jgi:hypothetical protein|uniref:Suppressor of fused domain protein n=2 Tax=Amedibacillus TaxID=2749846 RepID=A0A7G9GL35_9FIRM|nr:MULTISPECIES: suppressor of fused domain protein [Bacillota]QNM11517.1 suppressor of fused domain protein [[Eubacterium] hominis]MCH4285241.1 suppressor of fused domain protein [Amedibacillus hominis]RGB56264.1 suppressor of fused domain protein [Absiella sp. AM22-9]RGB62027.1 suppressor of fused domain protein [Absiella sp. AM10-20]RGB70151.1 suppressor of fused domain protein [Absiella sp. AM09-45]